MNKCFITSQVATAWEWTMMECAQNSQTNYRQPKHVTIIRYNGHSLLTRHTPLPPHHLIGPTDLSQSPCLPSIWNSPGLFSHPHHTPPYSPNLTTTHLRVLLQSQLHLVLHLSPQTLRHYILFLQLSLQTRYLVISVLQLLLVGLDLG